MNVKLELFILVIVDVEEMDVVIDKRKWIIIN